MRRTAAPVLAGVTAAGVTAAAMNAWRSGRLPSALTRRLSRTNHAGDPVTLWEGPAAGVGALGGTLVGGLVARSGRAGMLPALVATTGGLVAGAYDDLYGTGQAKGLRGHLGALRRGRLTSGMVKVAVVGATAVSAAALASARGAARRSGPTDGPGLVTLAGIAADAVTIAGTANLVNLLDLRPGRAVKAVALLCAPLLAWRTAAVPAAAGLGAALAAAPADLAASAMLGDTGANALGALAGTALAHATRRRVSARLLAAACVTGLNLASERISFTELIESTPWLRAVDAAGRRS